MPLVVEDGSGLAGADSFAALATADAFWAARPQTATAAAWTAAATTTREGALRTATARVCGLYGPRFVGRPTRGRDQALCWPRRAAMDADGLPLGETALPREVVAATCLIAGAVLRAEAEAEALATPADPATPGGPITEELVTLDAITLRTAYAAPAARTPSGRTVADRAADQDAALILADPDPGTREAAMLLAGLLRPAGTQVVRA